MSLIRLGYGHFPRYTFLSNSSWSNSLERPKARRAVLLKRQLIRPSKTLQWHYWNITCLPLATCWSLLYSRIVILFLLDRSAIIFVAQIKSNSFVENLDNLLWPEETRCVICQHFFRCVTGRYSTARLNVSETSQACDYHS